MNIKSLITKGVLSTYKGIGLATKGLIDLKVKVRAVIGRFIHLEYPFKFEINITGIKSIRFKLEYSVRGTVKAHLNITYNLVGKVKSNLDKSFFIKAAKTTHLAKKLHIQAVKSSVLQRDIDLAGTLLSRYYLNTNVLGTKRFTLVEYSQVTGKRSTKCFTNISLYGTKKRTFHKDLSIKARKDITPILTALDII